MAPGEICLRALRGVMEVLNGSIESSNRLLVSVKHKDGTCHKRRSLQTTPDAVGQVKRSAFEEMLRPDRPKHETFDQQSKAETTVHDVLGANSHRDVGDAGAQKTQLIVHFSII